MCGPQKAVIPNPKSDPNLIGEFMKVINLFWANGGSIVFFADGDPLFYQVNLFLEEANFPINRDEEKEIFLGNKNDYIEEDKSFYKNEIDEYDYDNDFREKSRDNFMDIMNYISKNDTLKGGQENKKKKKIRKI